MCDTFVYLPSSDRESTIFGKNSDREPNEAQYIVHYPANKRPYKMVKATFIEVECPEAVNSVILCQPFQMWGAEMGINEHGVVIGNEAVFTKIKFEKGNTGLTGMDILRLALEQSESALQAVKNITIYLEKYGQNACGGYLDKKMFYHNSFMVVDKSEAYVLETAGKYWAYKKYTEGYRAISNGLTLEDDYDEIHPEAEAYALKKSWSKKGEKLNFRDTFSAYWMPKLAACEARRNLSEKEGKKYTNMQVLDAFQILRSHAETEKDFLPQDGTTASLCMHASGLFTPHQSVGSMVVELRKDKEPTIWLTGTSSPCLSLFKPFYLHSPVLLPQNFIKPTAFSDKSLWWKWEKFHRKAIHSYPSLHKEMTEYQRVFEWKWVQMDREISNQNEVQQKGHDLTAQALRELELILNELLVTPSPELKIPFLYKHFWKAQNKLAAIKLSDKL